MSVFGFDPRVERHLIADEGEVIVDEVRKHWAAIVGAVLEMLAAVPALMLLAWVPQQVYWLPLFLALFLFVHGLWRILQARMDRFVITNMRVFRVHGILSQRIATMPISRILDISVHTPIIGRVIGYGHFVFESAAQDQGLREIRFVGSPDQRGATIQRVIQRSGLRGPARQMHRDEQRESASPTRRYDPAPRPDLYDTTPQRDPNDTAEMPWWRS
ncbi:PH domain-containing protein [Agromyces subbeticus]|uniref:PH domain-containing protein n=1 Tax=Agromyces subbeticus TaxID=293890 RepID=UPI0003B6FEB5|nr:PH domain-containing protein [Agromyces subbeticus]